MILRYSRVFSFRYPRALRVYPRIEGNFFSTTRLAFSFFFISPSLYLSSFCVLPPRSKVVLHLFISFLSNLRVRFLRDVHTPSVLLFSSQFFYLTYIFVSFSLCYSYPFVSFIYIHIRVWVSWSQPYFCLANEADIFERKNLCQKSSEVVVVVVELDCPSKMYIFFMEYVAN